MATKKTKAFGTAVAVELAITALKNPAVQNLLKQAPSYLTRFREDRTQRHAAAVASGGSRTSRARDLLGQHRLEKRAASIRSLVDDLGSMPAGKRIDAATVEKVRDALDAIDLELRLAAHQSLVDRARHHYRISGQLDALVKALSAPMATDALP
jgi:hypothetical protein